LSAKPDAPPIEGVSVEPSSFRDPDSRVFYSDGRVLRALSEQGLADWRALASSPLLSELIDEGKLVSTRLLDDAEPAGVLPAAAVLEHEVVPFVSYPYEWCFGMLRQAALLQLELVRRALEHDLMLKDATPYNVQWRGPQPVFVDVGSFERLRPGEPWLGYRQFCMLFLYPLLLQAYKGMPFQPWLRGRIEGVSPGECRRLLSGRDLFRRGVATHVALHSRLERRYANTSRDLKRELGSAGFKKELILANVRRLERLVRRLRWDPPPSAWSEYSATTSYSEAEAQRKTEFVREVAGSRRWDLVWDLGCNDGRYSRIAAETARSVVALDGDASVVEMLFRELRDEGGAPILPLVADLVDPSPALGWRGLERRTLAERGTPELTLCLALVHHVVISANVPLVELVGWLRGLGTTLVVEFPTPDDPMVQRLLVRKREGDHPDYTRNDFERALGECFQVERTEPLSSGTRILYFARPKD